MKLQERDYWLCFNVCGGFGPKRFKIILQYFGSAEKAWQASKDEWQKLKLPQNLVDRFFDFKIKFDLSAYKLQLEKSLINFVTREDKEYPKLLKEIENLPYLIYIKGKLLPQDSLAVSIVGTRKVSGYGREATRKIVAGLVARNFTIVSGLARGVDSVSHRVTLEMGGRTIAVVGHGLDTIYPPENKPLADQITQSGAIISQFPLGVGSLPGNFPARNKIIAGISRGTVVVEGLTDSGSLITAGFARDFARPVFAVPGPITSALSEGPSKLIKSGARLVTGAEDILSELGIKNYELGMSQTKKLTLEKKEITFINQTEEKIWEALTTGIKHIDQIARENNLDMAGLSAALTQMELAGKIKNLGNGEYCL